MKTHTEFPSNGSLPRPESAPDDRAADGSGASTSARSVTLLLREWSRGDRAAADRLFTHVYASLRRLARSQRRRAPEASLDSTALVHEAYLKLVGTEARDLRGRAHFFALAARAMRQVLSNEARRRRTTKRGAGATPVSLERIAAHEGAAAALRRDGDEQLAALDEALDRLERTSPRQCRVVECRFFAGLSVSETALALDVSDATVKRDWALAQAWLYRAVHDDARER
jgi:RNA polymerase sigma factor (TIGR02999 family)